MKRLKRAALAVPFFLAACHDEGRDIRNLNPTLTDAQVSTVSSVLKDLPKAQIISYGEDETRKRKTTVFKTFSGFVSYSVEPKKNPVLYFRPEMIVTVPPVYQKSMEEPVLRAEARGTLLQERLHSKSIVCMGQKEEAASMSALCHLKADKDKTQEFMIYNVPTNQGVSFNFMALKKAAKADQTLSDRIDYETTLYGKDARRANDVLDAAVNGYKAAEQGVEVIKPEKVRTHNPLAYGLVK